MNIPLASLTLALAAVAAPVLAAGPTTLPGVSDEETVIPSGGISRYHQGRGDVLFVLDRAGRWYRLALNDGCLSRAPSIDTLFFRPSGGTQRIDRFTRILFADTPGGMQMNCRIESIRRSEAPPQVDSQSRVTLD